MKVIKSSSDLAINGARPAFEEPKHVGRPNIGDKSQFLAYVDQIFEEKRLTNNGPLVQELEEKIANRHNVKHCIAMCNGTVALEIAIRALELKGEVILPSYTFVATAHALQWQEITPVFADINSTTHCIDPKAVRKMISSKTSGIIGVHLWGRPAPANELQEIADEYSLKLLFDAAHAFDCTYQGKKIGNLGEAEVLSFHATKFFNTFEGGAVLTNNDQLADKIRLMRNFGFAGVDSVVHPGTNGKLTEICAAMGLVNLENTDTLVSHNKANYLAYHERLNRIPSISSLPFDTTESNNYQYIVMEVGDSCPASRDSIINALHAENVLARKYFWPGCHNMHPYKELYPVADLALPNTQLVANRVISLPTGADVNEQDIAQICDIISHTVKSAL